MQELPCDCGARDLHEGMLVTPCAHAQQAVVSRGVQLHLSLQKENHNLLVTILGFASNSMPSLTAHCGIHISCKLYIYYKNSTCFNANNVQLDMPATLYLKRGRL